ncbi:MAG: hypothetical protein AB2374_16710 [Cytobacillus gottheilii]|uniref:hypothetical protein n=1 Tax=Cytobacillus gottheilii TaxID=859144 RepID=UPI003463D23A
MYQSGLSLSPYFTGEYLFCEDYLCILYYVNLFLMIQTRWLAVELMVNSSILVVDKKWEDLSLFLIAGDLSVI